MGTKRIRERRALVIKQSSQTHDLGCFWFPNLNLERHARQTSILFHQISPLQMELNPLNSLNERLLLAPLLPLTAQIRSSGKAMLNPAKEVDLIWITRLLQDALTLVPHLSWENSVRLCRADGPRPLDSRQFLLCNKRRMSDIADLDEWLASVAGGNGHWWRGGHEACGVLGAEAVPDRCDAVVSLRVEVGNGGGDDWVDELGGVWVLAIAAPSQPGHKVEVGWTIQLEGVAVEGVWHEGVVAVCGELVRHQLAVLPNANNVWQEQDSLLSVNHLLWLSDIGLDVVPKTDGVACWCAPIRYSSDESSAGDYGWY